MDVSLLRNSYIVCLLACFKGSANQYKGIIDCVQTVVREEGRSALLKVCIKHPLFSFHTKYESHVFIF